MQICRIKRKLTARKYVMREMLRKAGFVTWAVPRQHHETYALLLIACNRLCPAHPDRAYMVLLAHLRGVYRTQKVDYTKWRCAEKESKQGLIAMAMKLQNQDKNYDNCPICGNKWSVTKSDAAGNIVLDAAPSKLGVGYADVEQDILNRPPPPSKSERLVTLKATKLATKLARQAQNVHVSNVEVTK